MPNRFRRTSIILSFLLLAAGAARAQLLVPFAAKAGLPTASAKAKDSVGTDAHVAFIATFGSLSQPPLTLEFNLDNGKASAWAYVYYSPSQQKSATLGVVQIPIIGFQTQSIGQSIPLPAQLDLALDTSGAYSNSDQMIARLKTDTAFMRYRTELPDAKPALITFGQVLGVDSTSLPNGFPLDEPTWTLVFRGSGDSSMTCFVSSKTGEHFCQRIELPSSVPGYDGVAGTAALDVLPNPATGRTRIVLTLPEGTRVDASTRIELVDERGARVADLTASLSANAQRFVEFDAAALPAGLYYCRAIGANWSGVAGVVVTR